jgi:rhodanese-related sulfurtransferase
MLRLSAVRLFSSIGFEQMSQIVKDKQRGAASASSIVVIDVRSVEEVKESGLIPFAVNIPVNIVPLVLRDDFCGDEFEDSFGCEKPDPKVNRLSRTVVGCC